MQRSGKRVVTLQMCLSWGRRVHTSDIGKAGEARSDVRETASALQHIRVSFLPHRWIRGNFMLTIHAGHP